MYKRALTLLFCSLLAAHAWSDSVTDEKAVWSLEQAYWQYVGSNNAKAYLRLWDDRFIGWPGFSKAPVQKATIADWIAPLHKDPTTRYDYELTREAIRSFGDVVVVHYLVHDFYRSASTGELVKELDTYRITHTWQRRGDTWQIITGMSGAQASK